MKKKIEAAKKILRKYRKYKFKKTINANLKLLVKRKNIWKRFSHVQMIKFLGNGFLKLKEVVK